MKKVVVFLWWIVVSVLSQGSTNPDTFPYFAVDAIHDITVDTVADTTFTSVLRESVEYVYPEFYRIWIPENIGQFSVTAHPVTNAGMDITLIFSLEEPHNDPTESPYCFDFYQSCSYSVGYSCFCRSFDQYDYVYASGSSSSTSTFNLDKFRPGKHAFLTLYAYGLTTNVTYDIVLSPILVCSNGSVPAFDGYTATCQSQITTVTANGESFSGTQTNGSVDVYSLLVPQNVSHVWAWLTTPASDATMTVAGGFVSNSLTVNDGYTTYGGNYGTSGEYSYELSVIDPDGNFTLFFTVQTGTEYNISFHWSNCGPGYAGAGNYQVNYNLAEYDFNIEDCTDTVVFNNVNLLTIPSTLNFDLPAYDSSRDYDYEGQYGFISVPQGVVGYANFSCTTNGSSEVYVGFTKNAMADCHYGVTRHLTCDGQDRFILLSQDLWIGGYWSVAACNWDYYPVHVTLSVGGGVSVPASPSPIPSGGSGSPSASPGSSTSEDSSISSIVVPSLYLMALLTLIQL